MILRQNIPEFYQVRFAMDPTLSKYFLRWILLCPTLVCDGTTQIHLKALQVRLIGNQGLVSNNLGDFVPSVSNGCGRDAFLKFNFEMDLDETYL